MPKPAIRDAAPDIPAGELCRCGARTWGTHGADTLVTIAQCALARHERRTLRPSVNTVSAIEAIGLKLERADRHLAEFENAFGAYYARRPMHLDGYFDEPQSQWVATVRVTEAPPAAFGPIIGDIAHNLRSALDQLTWQLALLRTATPYKRTQFPIFTDPDNYAKDGTRLLQSLEPEHAGFIERLQPYHEDDPTETLLYGLNVLSNVDKHREMHFANSALTGASLTIRMTGGGVGFGAMQLNFGQFTDGSEVARLHDVVQGVDDEPPQFEIDIQGAFDLGVTDEEGNELSVYAGMYATREFVEDIVDWFKPLL